MDINPNLPIEKQYDEIAKIPISMNELKRLLPTIPVFVYEELKQFINNPREFIKILNGNVWKSMIILYQESANYGHWVCVILYDDYIYYFDSYGEPIDIYIGVPPCINKNKYLSYLIQKLNIPLRYNDYAYQSRGSDIATCGFHCACRIIMRNKYKEYKRMFKNSPPITSDDKVSYILYNLKH